VVEDIDVSRAEALLGARFPAGLRGLYLVSDGVFDKVGQWFVLWPLGDVLRRNEKAWLGEDVGRQRLVGFGDDGTGAPFCVPRDGGVGVFTWNLIDGVAYRLADTVEEFWSGWVSGTIAT
jgi:hypothetical protein